MVNQEILNTIKKYLSGVTNKGIYIKKHIYLEAMVNCGGFKL